MIYTERILFLITLDLNLIIWTDIRIVSIGKQTSTVTSKSLYQSGSNNVLLEYWTLQMAIGFTSLEYLDTTHLSNHYWDTEHFLQFDQN